MIIPGLLGHPEEKTFKDFSSRLEGCGHVVIKIAWPHFPDNLDKYSMSETIGYVKKIVSTLNLSELVILGHSMGRIIACEVAAEMQPQKLGLIVSPYQAGTDDDLAGKYKEWKEKGYRELTSSVHGNLKIPFSFIEDAKNYNALDKIGLITCPKLFIAGENDEKVPYQSSKKIFDLASEPK